MTYFCVGIKWGCVTTFHDRVDRTESGHMGFASNMRERVWCNDYLLGLLG